MDHLPKPRTGNPPFRDAKSPRRGTILLGNVHDGFTNGPFDQYPARRGTTQEQILRGDFPSEKSEDVAVLVQNWLFFGLLEEAFQIPVPTTDFTRVLGEVSVLNTQRLPQYIEQWEERVRRSESLVRVSWAAQLRRVYRETCRLLQLLGGGTLLVRFPKDFIDYLNPLLILLETLQCNTTAIFQDGAEHEPLFTVLSAETRSEFVNQGWCLYTITNFLLPPGSPSLVEYARSFGDRPSFLGGQNHSDCTENNCALATIDSSTYVAKHRREYCNGEAVCRWLRPDMDVIRSSLLSRRVPVVKYMGKHGLITEERSDDNYVAISHVWADGMGSTSEQGLPECQVEYLSEGASLAYRAVRNEKDAVASSPTMSSFWIDSLCVPKEPGLRNEAIVQMSRTYAAAAAVLVIDASMAYSCLSDSIIQQAMVLYVSSWVRRMWTLTEALVSRELLFRFRDGVMDYRIFFGSQNLVQRVFGDPCGAMLISWLTELLVIPYKRGDAKVGASGILPAPTLDDIAIHLAKRTSSRVEDEILAIAAVFDLDVRPYLALNANERMARFLTEYQGGKVPSDIIFLDSPRLPFEGFNWAPQSFMNRRLAIQMKGTGTGSVSVATEQGLVGQYNCIHIDGDDDTNETRDRTPIANRACRMSLNQGREVFTAIVGQLLDPEIESLDDIFILLPKAIEQGEEFLAAGVRPIAELQVGEEELVQVQMAFYIHVFHEDHLISSEAPLLTVNGTISSRMFLII